MAIGSLQYREMVSLMKDIRDTMEALDHANRVKRLYVDRQFDVPKKVEQKVKDWEKMLDELKAEHALYPGSKYNPENKFLM